MPIDEKRLSICMETLHFEDEMLRQARSLTLSSGYRPAIKGTLPMLVAQIPEGYNVIFGETFFEKILWKL